VIVSRNNVSETFDALGTRRIVVRLTWKLCILHKTRLTSWYIRKLNLYIWELASKHWTLCRNTSQLISKLNRIISYVKSKALLLQSKKKVPQWSLHPKIGYGQYSNKRNTTVFHLTACTPWIPLSCLIRIEA
jgi:hypothetical protein